jgi:ubiquinone/menaquinone biosynthesis C-methylase UbiE
MARVVWRCPTPPVIERYRKHLGHRHLDVGPGTGYFIEKAAPPAGTEITLLDPNPNVLARCSRRLAAIHPTTVEAFALLLLADMKAEIVTHLDFALDKG